jgi:glycosyltransferase involved in cell wall biosynthesis
MDYQYRFTVFTSCYNSERFIHRVFESLDSQTFRDFEWLVIDDASSDRTVQIIRDYIKTAKFPVQFIERKENKMLSENVNLGVELARGELMVFAGHDDRFDPEALEVFDSTWTKYGNENISGIWCLCRDQHNNLHGNEFPEPVIISNYFDLFKKYIYRKERFGCTRTEVLKQFPNDTAKSVFIPEDVLWGSIALRYQTIYMNRILRTYYIEDGNPVSLAKSPRSRYADGIFYSYSVWVNRFIERLKPNFWFKLRIYSAYCFYAVLANIKYKKAVAAIESKCKKLVVLLIFPAIISGFKVIRLFKKLDK